MRSQAVHPDAKILVVDDDPDLTALFEQVLSSAGYRRVRLLNDPRSFATMFVEHAPDLVILDLGMPGVDGYEILSWLRELTLPEVYLPVLVLTGTADPATRRRAFEAGANDFLSKPPDITEMTLRIGNLLETRMLHRSLRDQNAQLEIAVNERTRDLRSALADLRSSHEETVRRFAAAAEYRDGETASHLRRIGSYAHGLAAAAGLDAEMCDLVAIASPMHDIGKICVPDKVLLNDAALTPEEFDVMKSHAEIGYQILKGSASRLLETAAMIAWTHHERWDGSGYPRGLSGRMIPIAGRIVAVADAFDSMTSVRRYKAALPRVRALDLLRAGRGSQFDPDLVDAFVEMTARAPAVDVR